MSKTMPKFDKDEGKKLPRPTTKKGGKKQC